MKETAQPEPELWRGNVRAYIGCERLVCERLFVMNGYTEDVSLRRRAPPAAREGPGCEPG
jgi:hypothetical protein